MDLWRHTWAELTGNILPSGGSMAMPEPMPFEQEQVSPFPSNPRYGTAPLGSMQNQVLVRKGSDGVWECIGWYLDDTVIVFEDGRQGWGTELILRCMEHRSGLPVTKTLSDKGMAALRRAHRISIERALSAREKVPSDVLAEYPEIESKDS
jgi:hypothetical protein